MKKLNDYITQHNESRQMHLQFLLENKPLLFENYEADENDYLIFLKCMEVYSNTGQNHFERYTRFVYMMHEEHLEDGIGGFLHSYIGQYIEDPLNTFKQHTLDFISDMKFFEIETVNGKTCDDYITFISEADDIYNTILEVEKATEHINKKIESDKQQERYFNFENLNYDLFEELAPICRDRLLSEQHNLHSILNTGYDLKDEETFLILLFNGNTPFRIGVSKNPLNWLNVHQSEVVNPKFNLLPIHEYLAQELMVKLALYLNIYPNNSSMITIDNKYFCNLNTAKRIYRDLYNLSLRKLKTIISDSGIWTIKLGDSIILEKHELDKVIRRHLNIHL